MSPLSVLPDVASNMLDRRFLHHMPQGFCTAHPAGGLFALVGFA